MTATMLDRPARLDGPIRAHIAVAKYAMTERDVMDALGLVKAETLAMISAEEQLRALTDLGLKPYDVLERDHNLLMYAGAAYIWQAVCGTTLSGGSGSALLTPYNNANAYIGVGDSATAAAATQTDLQAASNKVRVVMDATYPIISDGTASTNAPAVFRATFITSAGNFVWNEWALFNATSSGRMFNRKVESLGTKTSSASWQFTITLTMA